MPIPLSLTRADYRCGDRMSACAARAPADGAPPMAAHLVRRETGRMPAAPAGHLRVIRGHGPTEAGPPAAPLLLVCNRPCRNPAPISTSQTSILCRRPAWLLCEHGPAVGPVPGVYGDFTPEAAATRSAALDRTSGVPFATAERHIDTTPEHAWSVRGRDTVLGRFKLSQRSSSDFIESRPRC